MSRIKSHGEQSYIPARNETERGSPALITLEKVYPRGTTVTARVVEVIPEGVIGTIESGPGVRAWVHRLEWTYQKRLLDLAVKVQSGEHFAGKVIGYDRKGLVLSRKRLIPDPLVEFKAKYRLGDRVIGRFILLLQKEGGALIEIGAGEAAVDGFIPRSELPPAAQSEDGFGLLVGDELAVRIIGFNSDEVVVSVREQLRRRDAWIASCERKEPTTLQHSPKVALPLERKLYAQRLAETPALATTLRVGAEIRRVLLIEDEESVAISLQAALQRCGLEVRTCSEPVAAASILAEGAVDLLILDRNLNGEEGISLLSDASVQERVRFFCILTGTPSPEVLSGHTGLADSSRLLVLDKPTSPETLLSKLDELLARRADPPIESGLAIYPDSDSERTLSDDFEASRFSPGEIETVVEELRAYCGADFACVLALEEGSVFRLVAGKFFELSRANQQQLEYSPVGEAIRRRSFVFQCPIDESAKQYYRHLLEISPLHAFQGFGLSYADEAKYGVVLANEKTRELYQLSRKERQLWELRITQYLVETRFAKTVLENQTLMLKGMLSSALLHEVGNRLQTLQDHSALQVDVVKEIFTSSKSMEEKQIVDLLKSTDGVRGATMELDGLVQTFRHLFAGSQAENLRIGILLERLERAFRTVASREKLQLRLSIEKKLPAIYINPKLFEQPILNLLLNAKEQMALAGSATRWIWVGARSTKDDRFPIQITVRDTGPGIHARDCRKVFELFFTTKPCGTGLGLFISRLLVERFGGRLGLAKTNIFEGSEFYIDLPAGIIK